MKIRYPVPPVIPGTMLLEIIDNQTENAIALSTTGNRISTRKRTLTQAYYEP